MSHIAKAIACSAPRLCWAAGRLLFKARRLASLHVDACAAVLAHLHEQVANVIEGEFELTIDGETQVIRPGVVGIISPDALHSGRALTPCRIIDAFHPPREDCQ